MRVLVSGADGFAGRHLVSQLELAGHQVLGLVFQRPATDGEVRVDLTRAYELASLEDPVDAVVHAAGVVDPAAGLHAMYAVNVHGTSNLLAWARARGARHFVHLSSVAVYGPMVLGEGRDENTPRLGRVAGLPYMRTKAQGEVLVERSGLGYSLLRPPAIVGAGDTVISRGFVEALAGTGIPLVPGAHSGRRVSVAFAEGTAEVVARLLDRGPLGGALHMVDAEVSLGELAETYAGALNRKCNFSTVAWSDVLARRDDPGFQWLVASARFGQHYCPAKLFRELGYRSQIGLEKAVAAGISGLQGDRRSLF
jgi:nucleoside-diphosphate-sugar epimerase